MKSSFFIRLKTALLFFFSIAILVPKLRSQDVSSFADVAFANAECMRNYDVSFRRIFAAEIPSGKSEFDKFVERQAKEKLSLWDEKRVSGRLVVDKGGSLNPERLFFVKEVLVFWQGKIVDRRSDFVWWKDGIETQCYSEAKGEKASGKSTIGQCFSRHQIPCFDSFDGTTRAPPASIRFWEDHSNYWELIKGYTSTWKVSRSAAGRIQIENKTSNSRRVKQFDPVSLQLIHFRIASIDASTGEEDSSKAVEANFSWENRKNVYVLRSEIMREPQAGMVMSNGTTTYSWHLFNEDDFEFPIKVTDELSLEESLDFLIDGQSKLSDGTEGEKK